MTPSPTSVKQTASVKDALAVLRTLEVRHVPVVNEAMEVVGMVSDRDLAWVDRIEELLEPDRLRARLARSVSDVMSSNVVSFEVEDDLGEVIEAMVEDRIGAVPVTDPEGRLVGIISYVDVLRAAHDMLGE